MLQTSENQTKHFSIECTVRNISVRGLLKNMSEGTPVPIIINNDTVISLLQSYVRGYYV